MDTPVDRPNLLLLLLSEIWVKDDDVMWLKSRKENAVESFELCKS